MFSVKAPKKYLSKQKIESLFFVTIKKLRFGEYIL